MNVPSDGSRAGLRARRAAHAVVVAIAVVFIGASAAQIVTAVFGPRTQLAPPSGPTGSSDRACAEGIHSLAMALDRAAVGVWSPRATRTAMSIEESAVLRSFREGLVPEWNAEASVGNACAASREGFEAWTALLRLRRAEEQVVLREFVELVPLRSDVMAHLPADMR